MASHRAHQEAVHGTLGLLYEICGGGRIQAARGSRNDQLMKKRSPKLEKAFDRLAERETHLSRLPAVAGGILGCTSKTFRRDIIIGSIEMHDQLLRELAPMRAEPVALTVG